MNCLIWAGPAQYIAEVGLGWSIGVPCVLGSRLLLNMGEAWYKKVETVPSERTLQRQTGIELHDTPRNLEPSFAVGSFARNGIEESPGITP